MLTFDDLTRILNQYYIFMVISMNALIITNTVNSFPMNSFLRMALYIALSVTSHHTGRCEINHVSRQQQNTYVASEQVYNNVHEYIIDVFFTHYECLSNSLSLLFNRIL